MANLPAEQKSDCEHLECLEEVCPGCGLFVDPYGNTEAVFKYCSFPDCGCDGARLCMAGDANSSACAMNIERGSL